MSEAELIFTALAELSTRQIAESVDATGLKENAEAGKEGGTIAKRARLELVLVASDYIFTVSGTSKWRQKAVFVTPPAAIDPIKS